MQTGKEHPVTKMDRHRWAEGGADAKSRQSNPFVVVRECHYKKGSWPCKHLLGSEPLKKGQTFFKPRKRKKL